METIANFACQHAQSAHWFLFLLLLLAGINVPISEDFILLTAGAIASVCIPEDALYLFTWVYAGCWISAWEAYWIGRYFGPKLYNIHWFHKFINQKKIDRLQFYYEKFGVFTFIAGRFIPGGVRNALFMTAGLGKMPFLKFVLRDGLACLISSSTLFYIGYTFGENYQTVIKYLSTYDKIAFLCIATIALALAVYLWKNAKSKTIV